MDARSGRGPVGRLAPSPTGVLHLGNARTFLWTWLDVRARGGTLLLRIEDIDGPRVRTETIDQTLEDLCWLGLDWDGPVTRQSERLATYEEHVDALLEVGLAYPCVCTRKEVEDASSAPHEEWMDSAPYPGTCRGRFATCAEAMAATGREPAVRFRVDVDEVPFDDRFRGTEPGRIAGDFVIQKRDRGPAYQLAVVVDDHLQGVTEVVRGDDLVASTPRQILLYRALGWVPPRFAHVPLVVGPDGRRLAKRHGDTSLRTLRERGFSAADVVGAFAVDAGLVGPGTRIDARELVAEFRLERVPEGRMVTTEADWLEPPGPGAPGTAP
jgi:glutamyl-tRNA synthetase